MVLSFLFINPRVPVAVSTITVDNRWKALSKSFLQIINFSLIWNKTCIRFTFHTVQAKLMLNKTCVCKSGEQGASNWYFQFAWGRAEKIVRLRCWHLGYLKLNRWRAEKSAHLFCRRSSCSLPVSGNDKHEMRLLPFSGQ